MWFTDILGFLKSFAITIDELEDALEEGVRFDGATLHGFKLTTETEMIAIPDASTFQILPWRPRQDSVARIFCDIYLPDKTPYGGDCRYILKKNLKKAAQKGYMYYIGPEIEFFFLKNSQKPEILDRGGYFDLTPLDVASDYRRQTVLSLAEMGIDVISSHHEGANSQHEIDLRHEDALTTADNIMTFKVTAKEIGQINNIYASFMPKPITGQNGSGLHIHQSLFKDDVNIFYDPERRNSISKEAEHFIAGLLRHSREYFAITNQWINSYKRLIPGFNAPTHASWGINSPEAMIRIPGSLSGKATSKRIEARNPDPACNPYLAFAVMLASGLRGIDEKYELPEPVDSTDSSFYEPLPGSLAEALTYFANSGFMKDVLGDVIHQKFLENKYYEIDKYSRYITDYEIDTYLPIL
jgi:glutamine synthetase